MSGILKHADGSIVELRTVKRFINSFAGQSLLPGDSEYDTARTLWNASIDKRPGLIARCGSTNDVVRAVQFARINNLLVAVKGGGHNVAGRALCDDGLVIDLSLMKQVSVDAPSRTVTGAPRFSPSPSAALCSERAISRTPNELTRAR